ncbi:fungal-specific transcription factor domain-containing protein [Penicillium verhagenii]|uniref:fungal-specific transcription factor domain-containing protein n=1 Tax=Penicillium verhagenii TaxID=1562060 RepID=UPI0025457900|nr:fungal-specific transcription factor domain-containing protein [Penicillium verhagenii]KAJ5931049.1 fungal-specific transcription factor domain-containing protein [Penicillium verhagenii]
MSVRISISTKSQNLAINSHHYRSLLKTTRSPVMIPLPDLSVAEDFLGNLDNFLQWDDIFNLEPPKAGYVGTPQFTAFEDGFAVPWAIPSKLIGSPNGLPTTSPRHDLPALECTMGNSNALLEANVLLRHFDEHVVPQITWVPMTQKSPLRILNIPAAMITLDQLIYMKQIPIKHANLSNLYAILACASYHLSIHPDFVPDKSSQYWDKITISSHSEAKSHLDLSLKLELKGRTKAKYKDQLMAMLSLTTYAVLTQNQTEARYHLINIEFLIRSRGLVKKRLSRRARLLHHQYTWIRILSESTLVIHNKIPHSTPCEAFWSHHLNSEETNILALRHGSLPQRDGNYELDDFLRIEPNESDSDLKVGDQKDVECNLGDIHLVDSRNYPDEQHSTINGISETWLGLLSQTTRLANVLDQINNKSCTMSAERQLALHRRSNYLEGMICSFTSRRMLPGDGKPKFHMTRALNAALVIYFYRRVRQVNPCILQGYVSQIIQELHRWDAALAQNGLNGPGTAWPAFMGGCEATETNDRGSILQWLDRASVQSGQASYSSAKKVMEEIWKRRDSRTSDADMPPKPGESMSFSWMEYSKEKLQWLILA